MRGTTKLVAVVLFSLVGCSGEDQSETMMVAPGSVMRKSWFSVPGSPVSAPVANPADTLMAEAKNLESSKQHVQAISVYAQVIRQYHGTAQETAAAERIKELNPDVVIDRYAQADANNPFEKVTPQPVPVQEAKPLSVTPRQSPSELAALAAIEYLDVWDGVERKALGMTEQHAREFKKSTHTLYVGKMCRKYNLTESHLRAAVRELSAQRYQLAMERQEEAALQYMIAFDPTCHPSRYSLMAGSAPSRSSGGSVHVRAYTRRDGTHVRAHTRSR